MPAFEPHGPRRIDIKILLSAYEFDPDKGSEAGDAWNWARALASQGHRVVVFSSDRGASDGRSQRVGELDDLHLVTIPVPKPFPLLRGKTAMYVRYLRWQREVLRYAEGLTSEEKFDVVHHVSWGSLMWGSPLWRLGLPFVFGPVGGGQVTPKGYGRYLGHLRAKEHLRTLMVRLLLPLNPLSRQTVRRGHVVLAANSETLRRVDQLGANRSYLSSHTAVPPGFSDGAEPRNVNPGEILRIVWVARLFPIKGLRLSLEALSQLRDLSWHLTIIGGGPLGSLVPTWLDELRIGHQVKWVGQIPWHDVREAYRNAHVMLFSSLRDSMGAQLYEALGCGLPAIALNHHGVKDMLPDDATVKIEVGSPEETIRNLANGIQELVEHPERIRAMSVAALEFAADNTWERKTETTYALIEKTLQADG